MPMHEISIMQAAMDIVLKNASKHNLHKITKINLDVGEMAGIVPESLEFAFSVLSKGTIAEGAELIINKIKATAKCNNCNIIFNVENYSKVCPVCRNFSSAVLTGYELLVTSIEGD